MITQKHDVQIDRDQLGNLIVKSKQPLPEIAKNTGVWLHKWVENSPDRIFIAERSGAGWRELSYLETLQKVRALAGGLLSRGIGAGSKILVISGNSVDHALLALATQYIGAAIIPLAEQYSLIPDAHSRLIQAAQITKPDMIFADDEHKYGKALALFEDMPIITSTGEKYASLDDLMKSGEFGIDEAYAKVSGQTVAKILMTSGSTSAPKAVLTTHQMLCANQIQLLSGLPFLKEKPPIVVDWLPWNHVFGGSHNFNVILSNGGTLYIDDGKPTPQLIARTIENLKMHSGTISYNVPIGFSMLLNAMKEDDILAKKYFENLDMIFYAGASLPQDVWSGLEDLAFKHHGSLPLMTSSWGLTETAPACIMQQEPIRRSGVIGVPLVGVDVKLIPSEDNRYEARVKGPNVFHEYLYEPQKTKDAFDEDGYFITGDAMAFVDENDPNKGLKFDGRISEEFKLLSGTWVRAGNLRLELLVELKGLASDIVITGADKKDIGLMIFPSANADHEKIISILTQRAQQGQSSSTHIARAIILDEPPNLAEGEITAKGNLNFNKILSRRKHTLDALYEGGEGVILIGNKR